MAEQDSVVDREDKTLPTSTDPAKEDISKREFNPLWLEQKPIDKHLTISTTTSHHERHKSNHYFGKHEGLLSPSSNTKIIDPKYNLLKPASCDDFSKSKSPVSNKVSDCSLNNNNIQQNNAFQNGGGHGGEKKKKKKKDHHRDRDAHKDLINKDKFPSQAGEGCNKVKLKANDSKNNVFSLKNFVKDEHESSFDSSVKSPKKKHKDGKTHSYDSQNNRNIHGSKRKSEVALDGTSVKKIKHRHNHIKLDEKEFPSEKLFSPTDKVKKNLNYNQPILQFEKLPIKKIKAVEQVGERKEKHIKKSHKSSNSIKKEKPSSLSLPSSPTKIIDKKSKYKNIEPLKPTVEEQKIKNKLTGTIFMLTLNCPI